MNEANTTILSSLSNALGMAPLVLSNDKQETEKDNLPTLAEEVSELSKEDREAEEDFYVARENTKDLIEKGQEALDGILRIAEGSEHPRAFEVAANLLNTMKEMNAGLLKLHETRRQLVPLPEPEKKSDEKQQITNNNVFIGSTQEFLDMIEAREKDGTVIEHES